MAKSKSAFFAQFVQGHLKRVEVFGELQDVGHFGLCHGEFESAAFEGLMSVLTTSLGSRLESPAPALKGRPFRRIRSSRL
jgi:hypothetical protein